jgi:hypothetical protein
MRGEIANQWQEADSICKQFSSHGYHNKWAIADFKEALKKVK